MRGAEGLTGNGRGVIGGGEGVYRDLCSPCCVNHCSCASWRELGLWARRKVRGKLRLLLPEFNGSTV